MPNIDEILGGARDAMSVKRVFGDPIENGGVTVVPVARVVGGGGGGGDDENNGGAGFGLTAKPAGVFVIKDGEVTWKPAIDPGLILLAGLAVFALWRLRR
ncbi:MAG TPA: spore germination protein GerW family protein [Gaiellaceae bacterium]|nr:spore germination protein GerW family protein [Gaiellaceae bacterium]